VSEPLHVTFVCFGNICRSPMAEKMFGHQLAARGLDSQVRVTSAGAVDWHTGSGLDPLARRVLQAHGYPTAHRAKQLNTDHLAADLAVAMDRSIVRMLANRRVPTERIRLLRSFDPRSGAVVSDVKNPWSGGYRDFEETHDVIETSLPGLHEWVDAQLAARGVAASPLAPTGEAR
jgi:protein-tyrosine phosphatase